MQVLSQSLLSICTVNILTLSNLALLSKLQIHILTFLLNTSSHDLDISPTAMRFYNARVVTAFPH
jgi:hypothetical protein